MVKGTSRQVIVVSAKEPRLFEQAIFILSDDAVSRGGVTEEILLQEADRLIGKPRDMKRRFYLYGTVWAAAGAFATALVWLLTTVV